MKGFATMARSDGGEDEENSCEEKDRLHTTAPETLQQRQRRQRRQQRGRRPGGIVQRALLVSRVGRGRADLEQPPRGGAFSSSPPSSSP